MKPSISVIIPTYNRREMVLEAVKSVLAQRGVWFELIVVDDGSTDGSYEALREYSSKLESGCSRGSSESRSPWLTEFRLEHTAHQGVAAARNVGASLAQGKFLAFLDSDDLWLPQKLKSQFDFMISHKEFRIAQCEEIWLRKGRRVNPGYRHRKRAGDIFIDSLSTCLISPSAVIMETSLFREAGGFDSRLKACEDYDLWLRLLVKNEVGLLPEALVIRRGGRPDQLSASVPALDRFRVITLLKLLADNALTPERRAAVVTVLQQKCQILAKGLRKRGRNEVASVYEEVAKIAEQSCRHGLLDEMERYRQLVSECSLSEELFDTTAPTNPEEQEGQKRSPTYRDVSLS